MTVGTVLLGTLAAWGLLCALWAAFGWLLPGLKGFVLVSFGLPPGEAAARYKWLKSLGLLDCPLQIVAEDAQVGPDMERCAGEELLARLEMERKRFDGTGNGDHSGHHQRGGVSEL